MEFEIKEYTGEFSSFKELQNLFAKIINFLILIIITPVLLISNFFNNFFGLPNSKQKQKPHDYKKINGYKLQRHFIDDDELPTDLDYPEEANDVKFFKMYSTPNIPSFSDKYFDYGDAETQQGLYLISINKEKNGMTLWCLNKKNIDLIKVKDLPSLWWDILEEEENVIRLRGNNGKTYYDIFVKEKNSPNH
ncbi:MAG TPA: hypothetical protein VNX01_07510 [Bacteroidia bacterium]|jgi:hypothetical protein|nr:hypothetical protein [Bacteroidia bacterium]